MQVQLAFERGDSMSEVSTKDKILDISMHLFTEFGYKRTTTKLIAQEAGINEVTVFRHFGSKEGIVKEIVQLKLPHLKSFKTYFETQAVYKLEEDLVKAAKIYYEAILINFELLLVLSHEMGPSFQKFFSKFPIEVMATLTNYFTKMQEDKKIVETDPELLASNFIAVNVGFALMNTLFSGNFVNCSFEKFINNTIQVFVRGVTL